MRYITQIKLEYRKNVIIDVGILSENISKKIKVINTIGEIPKKAPNIILQAIGKRDCFIDSSKNFYEEFNQFNES